MLALLYLAPVATRFVVTDERWRHWVERATPAPDGPAALAAWTAVALAAGAATVTLRDP